MLSSLLFDEIREWSERRYEPETSGDAAGTDGDVRSPEDPTVGSVDENSVDEVTSLLRSAASNSLMHHSRDLLLLLSRRYDRRWPRPMLRQYASMFEPVFGLNFQHSTEVPEEQRMDYIQAYLFALELQADKMQAELETMNRDLRRHEEVYPRFPHMLMVQQWMLRVPQDSLVYKQTLIRILWLNYVWQSLQKDQLMAEHTLEEIRACLEEGPHELRRPNCRYAPLIDRSTIEAHLTGLTRHVGVARLRALAAEKRYAEVLSAWREEMTEDADDASAAQLTSVKCEVRLLVHHAIYRTELWEEGFMHGLGSIDVARRCLQNWNQLEDCGLEVKTVRKFAWRSLKITTMCWDAMSEAERRQCRRGDSARAVRAICLLIQDLVRHAGRLVTEDVWFLLYEHLTLLEEQHAELRRSTARNRSEEIDLPPSLTCLFIAHEYLNSQDCCDRSHGRFLRRVLHISGRLVHQRRYAREYYGDADDVEWLFMQALYCLHGISRKSKNRVVDHHFTRRLPLRDYTSMQLVYRHFRPDAKPEFDSIRSLSIGAEMVHVVKSITERLDLFENKFGLSEETLNKLVTSDVNFFLDFKNKWDVEEKDNSGEFVISKEIYYLMADYHFKSRAVEEAVEFYRKDLRFNPLRFDSWAALSLARLSLVQKGLDQQDYSVMEAAIDDVKICMHGFECALTLNNKCSKLMVENGTLCYEIFSYSDKYYRQWQLRGSCPSVPLLRACCTWRRDMLRLAEQRFAEAIACGPDDEHELWYYCYMRGKCTEKTGRDLLTEVMPQYRKALELLHKAGAKYPRRVFFYGTIPTLSLETIEVFYRCHATLLKRLLRFKDRPAACPEMDEVEAELIALSGSDFAQADRVKSSHKRTRQKAPITPVIAATAVAAQRRSKRRVETEESCPTSEAEIEEEALISRSANSDVNDTLFAATEAVESVVAEVFRQIDVRICVDDILDQTVAVVGSEPPPLEDLLVLQWERCVILCLNAFELLIQRIPHHYKSVRQVTRICLLAGRLRNISKALEYLWTGGNIEGAKFPVYALFKDRKSNNLFNGIYRNPIHDLDRCGNFSHHMRSCVDLLLRALRERCDWVGLKEVCLSLLHSIPEVKNVCVTESELSMLQRRSFALCLQSVDQLLTDPASGWLPPDAEGYLGAVHPPGGTPEQQRLVVYKLWRLYRQATRYFPVLKNDAFRCVVRAFLLSGAQVKEGVPVIQQIREFLQLH